MDKIIIQITSGRGPLECCRAVAKVQELIIQNGKKSDINIEVIDNKKAALKGTLLSATLMARSPSLSEFVKEWEGTVLWISESPYRKMYKRKNWFVGISIFKIPEQRDWDDKDIRMETCRASGPGGQNVNKVKTAVRATHLPSGIQVMAMDSRSQLQNRKHCLQRLKFKVQAWQAKQMFLEQQYRWQEHNILERGNPVKTITASLI